MARKGRNTARGTDEADATLLACFINISVERAPTEEAVHLLATSCGLSSFFSSHFAYDNAQLFELGT
jgi:hypothetical protein